MRAEGAVDEIVDGQDGASDGRGVGRGGSGSDGKDVVGWWGGGGGEEWFGGGGVEGEGEGGGQGRGEGAGGRRRGETRGEGSGEEGGSGEDEFLEDKGEWLGVGSEGKEETNRTSALSKDKKRPRDRRWVGRVDVRS